jgi:hypothetical protein
MPNFLEQLVAEWHEFNGYFVRRNVMVGKRPAGGYEGELDIVAFHPGKKHLVHIEPSSDADSWDERERRFGRKFAAGKKFIPLLFSGFGVLPDIDHIALFIFASRKEHSTIGGGKILLVSELMADIRKELAPRSVLNAAVPEQFVILRALQFAAHYWTPNQ